MMAATWFPQPAAPRAPRQPLSALIVAELRSRGPLTSWQIALLLDRAKGAVDVTITLMEARGEVLRAGTRHRELGGRGGQLWGLK